MSNKLPWIKILMGLAIVALVFTQGTAIAEDGIKSFWKVGTLLTYKGWQGIDGDWSPYDQYVKCSGRVILPETQPNMYYLIEMFGRDDETMILRITSKGDGLLYNRGKEFSMFLNGPVGTSWEFEYEGHPGMGKIVEDGITLPFPNGPVYSNVVKWELYSMENPTDPVLQETHWMSPEVGFDVIIVQWSPDNPFIEWLVDITRK